MSEIKTESLFLGLFEGDYNHQRWLQDQGTLIKRLKATKDEYYKEQAKILETHQKANQASILMMEIMADRVERHEKSKETQEKIELDNDKEVC